MFGVSLSVIQRVTVNHRNLLSTCAPFLLQRRTGCETWMWWHWHCDSVSHNINDNVIAFKFSHTSTFQQSYSYSVTVIVVELSWFFCYDIWWYCGVCGCRCERLGSFHWEPRAVGLQGFPPVKHVWSVLEQRFVTPSGPGKCLSEFCIPGSRESNASVSWNVWQTVNGCK